MTVKAIVFIVFIGAAAAPYAGAYVLADHGTDVRGDGKLSTRCIAKR